MRVLLVHNQYQQRGGEDAVVEQEHTLLRAGGVEVERHGVSNDQISGPWQAVRTAMHLGYSNEAKRRLERSLHAWRPDLVHVHNFFPLLTPSIYDACDEARVPVVQTLHNYRLLCANALLLRDNKPCEDCVRGSPYWGAVRGCYRGSRLATLPVSRMIDRHRIEATWTRKVRRFIALSEFARGKFIEGGLPCERISVKPNFTADPGIGVGGSGGFVLFVGRLSEEKGLRTLLRAWQRPELPRLRIAGSGPLEGTLRKVAPRRVEFLGALSPERVSEEMRGAAFLIVPSIWYEPFGMVVIEALAHGLPVVASRIGALPELIRDGTDGALFEAGDPEDLTRVALELTGEGSRLARMADASRKAYEQRFTPERAFRNLTDIYRTALGHPA